MTTLIFGGGGHALEVTAAGWRAGLIRPDDADVRFVVAALTGGSRVDLPYPVLTDADVTAFLEGSAPRVVVAVGDGRVRERIVARLAASGVDAAFPNVIDPDARLIGSVPEGIGLVAFSGASVSLRTELGSHVHLNVDAALCHESVVGSYVTIAPKAVVCGRARIGARAFLGAGSVVVDDAVVPAGAVVGAGAVVLAGLTEPGTYVGVPARRRP
jgi:sugar O-acyltransferase (sialic acid O-acetyltransferase NeuD family)